MFQSMQEHWQSSQSHSGCTRITTPMSPVSLNPLCEGHKITYTQDLLFDPAFNQHCQPCLHSDDLILCSGSSILMKLLSQCIVGLVRLLISEAILATNAEGGKVMTGWTGHADVRELWVRGRRHAISGSALQYNSSYSTDWHRPLYVCHQ